jgi:HK97 family phage portal protein
MRGPFAGLTNTVVPKGVKLVSRRSSATRQTISSTTALKAYSQNPTLFPIVSRLALDTSNTEWGLYRPKKQPADNDADDMRTEIDSSQNLAAQLWETPNPFMTRSMFIETVQQHMELTGEGYWLIVRKPNPKTGIPTQIWPIRPDRMTPVPDPVEFMKGWIYRGPDDKDYALELTEVIQMKMPNPDDLLRGVGPVASAMTDIDSSRYSAEWNRNFFINGASPSGIVQVEHALGDDEFDTVQMRWRQAHQGIANAHRVAVLEAGMTWVDNSHTQRDMQFEELRKQSADFIRQAFGFPEFMLGNMENANKASAAAVMDMYDALLIDPRARRWKETLNARFLPMFGSNSRRIYFDYEPLVNEDEESKAAIISTRALAAQTLVSSGFDAKAVLQVVGLPDMEWEDRTPQIAQDNEDEPPSSNPEEGED